MLKVHVKQGLSLPIGWRYERYRSRKETVSRFMYLEVGLLLDVRFKCTHNCYTVVKCRWKANGTIFNQKTSYELRYPCTKKWPGKVLLWMLNEQYLTLARFTEKERISSPPQVHPTSPAPNL